MSARAQLLLGPVAGGQYSWTSFSDKYYKDLYNVEGVWGFHAGGQVSFRVHKQFFLHTSLLYSKKGKVLKGDADFSRLGAQYRLTKLTATYNYLELPIIYTVEFRKQTKGGKVYKWYLGAGPNVSYWLNGKGTILNQETAEPSDGGTLNYKVVFGKNPDYVGPGEMVVEDPNRFQLGLNIMAGLVFEPMPKQQFMLSIRYEIGHSNLSPESEGTFLSTMYKDNMQIRNQGARVSLAYLIDTNIKDRKKGKSTIKKRMR
ncbi:porin family protein [Chryseosolibacter indicus]|uniref:Outer membrane beta-barrel protein n=1 Tax=Chryseosolibacter indicus TaxID=2782351 RepID=A0ABS5VQ54_9BACT|nr:outer membrane beta-barrel protein [Chryseosolibacter indicus]